MYSVSYNAKLEPFHYHLLRIIDRKLSFTTFSKVYNEFSLKKAKKKWDGKECEGDKKRKSNLCLGEKVGHVIIMEIPRLHEKFKLIFLKKHFERKHKVQLGKLIVSLCFHVK